MSTIPMPDTGGEQRPAPGRRLSPRTADALRRVVVLAAAEARDRGEPIAGRLGLARRDVAAILAALPDLAVVVGDLALGADHVPDEEEDQVRLLLTISLADEGDDGRRMAAIMARRAMEPDHLWQDMGLACRGDLSALIAELFPALHARNTRSMRWKKFFYRELCEAEGFVLCAAPSCGACADHAACFGPEDGESRLAEIRRAAN